MNERAEERRKEERRGERDWPCLGHVMVAVLVVVHSYNTIFYPALAWEVDASLLPASEHSELP